MSEDFKDKNQFSLCCSSVSCADSDVNRITRSTFLASAGSLAAGGLALGGLEPVSAPKDRTSESPAATRIL